jgi:iron-sulfur cluster assembly accessory protein
MIITEKAKQKVSELIKETRISIPDRDIFLRISVQPGGCSGLRYQTFFDYEKLDGDTDYDFEDFTLKLDRMSVPYLEGSTLDFVDTIEKQGFTIDNPNAAGSCACGDSFN